MAKLEPEEREAFRAAAQQGKRLVVEPRLRRLTPSQYIAFATQAARFTKAGKVRAPIKGEHWKL